MAKGITVKICPLPDYNRSESSDYILCGLDFGIGCGEEIRHFRSESSNNCIKELLSEIEEFLSGEITSDHELYYYIPYIYGDFCVYPYSFRIDAARGVWTFRYKRKQNDEEFDFTVDLSREEIISMRDQIEDQYRKIEWDSLGITSVYTFHLPDRAFEWCYSAKDFCKALNGLCVKKRIKAMYVGALNYADPLQVRENYVNYYLGSRLILQTDGFLLDFLIHASGLFEWRVFRDSEYTVTGPVRKLIGDYDKEYCAVGDAYGMFRAEYAGIGIERVTVDETDCWS